MKSVYLYCLFFAIVNTVSQNIFAQCVSQINLQNPSFEGDTGQNTAPPSWASCGWGSNVLSAASSVNLTGESINGVTYGIIIDSTPAAYEGNTYLGLGYNNEQGAQGVTQKLSPPMVAGLPYSTSIKLALPSSITTFDVNGDQKGNIPASEDCAGILIYGGYSPCDLNTLLWSSGPISNTNWENYPVSFTPANDYTYLSIVIYGGCDQQTMNESASSFIYVDTIAPLVPGFNISAVVNQNNLCSSDSTGKATVHVLNGSAPFSYQWNSNPPQTDSVLNNVPAGTYMVTVTSDSGCATASVTITASSFLTLSTIANTSSCFTTGDGSVTATASGGSTPYSYYWSNGDTTSNIATHLFSGTYTVTVTDLHMCTVSGTVNIDSAAPMHITANVKPAACPDYNNGYIIAGVTGGTPGYRYLWSTSANNTNITLLNDTAGAYTITITDAYSCTASATFHVGTTSPSDTLSVTNAQACNGHIINGSISANPSGGTPSYSFLWNTNPPQTSSEVADLPAGVYIVTVMDAAGCKAVDTATVALMPGISLNVSTAGTHCGTNGGQATAYITVGTAPFNYHWNNGDTSATIMNLSQGTYRVTVTGSGGCSATASATINTSGSGNDITITSNKSVMCSGDSAHICAPASYFSYLWNTGSVTPCIDVQSAGNYYLTVTDNGGCSATSNHLGISVYPNPPVLISANGDTLTSYQAVTYQWYLNGVPISGATSDLYIARESGSYVVLVSDTNGCTETSSPYPLNLSGIEELNENEWVKVYPNPFAASSLQMAVSNDLVGSTVEVFDDNGKLIYTSKMTNSKSQIELNATGGVYLMRITSGSKNMNLKLIKL